MKIVFEQSFWGLVILTGLLLAAAITLLTYYRNEDNKELDLWQKRLLMALRFLSVVFLSFLFTIPLIKTLRKITQYPAIVIALDNSMSMKGLPGGKDQTESVLELGGTLFKGFEDHFNIIRYTFGEKTDREGVTDFTEKSSDYSQMLSTVFDNHFNENIGALVIVGDGNYNQGENPLSLANKLNFPVYAVGTGDTSVIKDARIADLRVNKTAFSGNQFPVEVDIRFTSLRNTSAEFFIFHEKEKVFSKVINITGEDYFVTIPANLLASGKGLQTYRALISITSGEQNSYNNSWTFIMNVMENKQKILMLSEGSHPDVGAIKDALEKQINYEVTVYTSGTFPDNIKGNNLVVLNQLPSSSQSCSQLIEQSGKLRIPLLFIIGSGTMLAQLNSLGIGVEIVPMAGEFDEAQVAMNEMFVSFTMSNDLKNNLNRYPPLKVPFAQYSLSEEYREIAFQRIKNMVTSKPLIAVGSTQGVKTGIIFGEGIWRWRLYNYMVSGDHLEFNELMDRLVQYLAIRDNDDNFVVDFKPVYRETENILMSAKVYNDSYEPVTSPDVTMIITDSTRREYTYAFDKGSNFYYLNAGIFPPGKYHFTASTRLGSSGYTESGNFAVVPVNLEQINYQANHRMLFQLSHETNGGYYTPSEVESLIKTIKENSSIKTTNYFQTLLKELLNIRWIFLILLVLLSTEWFLRKFWGIY